MSSTPTNTLEELLRPVGVQLALFFDRFGFRRNLGRIWASIYLSPYPLSQQDLCEKLDLSVGLVSSSLKELAHWEMILPTDVEGSRRTHYLPEERLIRIVAAILTKRELTTVHNLQESISTLQDSGTWQELGAQHPDIKLLNRRIDSIKRLVTLYRGFAEIIITLAQHGHGAIKPALSLINRFRGEF